MDGTTNFVHGIPIFAISVALIDDQNEELVGVVNEIGRNEIFHAAKGNGSFLENRKIEVSPVNQLSDALLATGFPYQRFEILDNFVDVMKKILQNSHGLRRMGSAAVDLAYTACGRVEGFYEFDLKSWDIAAGTLLVKEAGGIVTDFNGGRNYLFGGELVAAGDLHQQIVMMLKEHWPLEKQI